MAVLPSINVYWEDQKLTVTRSQRESIKHNDSPTVLRQLTGTVLKLKLKESQIVGSQAKVCNIKDLTLLC